MVDDVRPGISARGHRPERASQADPGDLPDRAWKIFDGVTARIEHADTKASVMLGACGVAAAAVLSLIARSSERGLPLVIAMMASGVFLLIAAACSCAALWPRRQRGDVPANLLYFDHIVRGPHDTSAAYEEALRALLADTAALTAALAMQIWATSQVASRKYDWLDRAMISLFGALAALGVGAVIFAIN
jgi:hypothetical protein